VLPTLFPWVAAACGRHIKKAPAATGAKSTRILGRFPVYPIRGALGVARPFGRDRRNILARMAHAALGKRPCRPISRACSLMVSAFLRADLRRSSARCRRTGEAAPGRRDSWSLRMAYRGYGWPRPSFRHLITHPMRGRAANLSSPAGRKAMRRGRMDPMRYVALLDGKAGAYGVVVPDLPGCTSAGKTADAAYRNTIEAVRLWIEDAREAGKKIARPRAPEGLRADRNGRPGLAAGAILMWIPGRARYRPAGKGRRLTKRPLRMD